MDLINVRFLSHPLNWAYVWLVLLGGSILWTVIVEGFHAQATAINPD